MAPSRVWGMNLLSCMHVSAWKLPDKREVMPVNQPQRLWSQRMVPSATPALTRVPISSNTSFRFPGRH